MAVLRNKRPFGEDLIKDNEQQMLFAAHHGDFFTAKEYARKNKNTLMRWLKQTHEGEEDYNELQKRIRTYKGIIEALNNEEMP